MEVLLSSPALLVALEEGKLSLAAPAWGRFSLVGLAPALICDGQRVEPSQAALERAPGGEVVVRWPFAELPVELWQRLAWRGQWLSVETKLANKGNLPLVLNRALLLGGQVRSVSDEPSSVRLLYEGGYSAWVRPVAALLQEGTGPSGPAEAAFLALGEGRAEGAGVLSQMASVLYAPAEAKAFLAGFTSYRRWLGQVHWSLAAERGVASWGVGFDGGDLEILPGEELALESFVLATAQDPWRLWEGYIDLVAQANGLTALPRPPVSWCSWYPHRLGVSEEKVLANAAVAAARLRELGLSVIEVDLGWEKGYLPSSYEENEQFPHGLAWLAERLREYGFKLGAWKAPYTVSEFDPICREHPEWLLRGPDGKPQPLGEWFWIPHGQTYALDLTHPGAQAYLRERIRSLAQRGVRYLKTDFIGAASAPSARGRHNRRMVAGGGIEAARLGSAIIAEEMRRADPEALLLNCNPYEPAGLGHYNLLYTCNDTGNTGFVGWQHLREVYTTVAVHLPKNGRWGIIQPSCLCVGLPGTLEEARVRATATFLSGGQVDISDDLGALPEDRWQVLLSTLPPLGRSARPVDLFEPLPVRSLGYEALCRGEEDALGAGQPKEGPRIWHLPVEHEAERWDLVALFEFDLPAAKLPLITWFQVPLERLGLDAASRYWAYEFWSGQFLGEVPRPRLPEGAYRHPGDAATLVLPGKEGCLEVAFFGPAVKLLVLRPVRPHPWPVGTSFHQSGGAELRNVRWDEASRTLSGQLCRPAGQVGTITVASPIGLEAEASVAGRIVPVRAVAGGALAFDVVTEGPETAWQVRWR